VGFAPENGTSLFASTGIRLYPEYLKAKDGLVKLSRSQQKQRIE